MKPPTADELLNAIDHFVTNKIEAYLYSDPESAERFTDYIAFARADLRATLEKMLP